MTSRPRASTTSSQASSSSHGNNDPSSSPTESTADLTQLARWVAAKSKAPDGSRRLFLLCLLLCRRRQRERRRRRRRLVGSIWSARRCDETHSRQYGLSRRWRGRRRRVRDGRNGEHKAVGAMEKHGTTRRTSER